MASHSGQTPWFGPGGMATLGGFMVANGLLGLVCGLVPTIGRMLPLAPLLLGVLGVAFGGCLGVWILWRRQTQPVVVTPVNAQGTDPMPTTPSQFAVGPRPSSGKSVRLSARAQEMQRRARSGSSGVNHIVDPGPSSSSLPAASPQSAFAAAPAIGSQSLQMDDLWQRQANAIERNLSNPGQPRLDPKVVQAAQAEQAATPQHRNPTWITGPEPGTLHDASELFVPENDTIHDFRAPVRDLDQDSDTGLAPAATSGSWTDELWQDDNDFDNWLQGNNGRQQTSGTVPEQPIMSGQRRRSRTRPPTDPGTLHDVGAMNRPRRAQSLDYIDAASPSVPDD